MNQKYLLYMYLLKARTFIALLIVVGFFSVMVPNFLTPSNLLIMTQHVAITGLLAIGMTLVILTGGIDLSVGAVAGICGMVAGALLTNGIPLWGGNTLFLNVPEVVLVVAIFGVLVGLINGTVITRLGVAPFICTLGMMYVARGAALLFNDGGTYANLVGVPALGNTGFFAAWFRHRTGRLPADLADARLFTARPLPDAQNPAGSLYLRHWRQ